MSSSTWGTYVLGDLCQVTSSKRIFSEEYVNYGVPFYRSKEVIEKALGEDVTENYYISRERFEEIRKGFGSPKSGDVLISSVGNRSGIPYLVKDDDGDFYFKDGNLIWFRKFNEKIDSKWLSFWLKSTSGQNALNSIMIGSAQKALTIEGVSSLSITLPDTSTQKIISNILSSLDEKIELNRRMNQTLESMARTVFRQSFVDNDEVKGWEEKRMGEFAAVVDHVANGSFALTRKSASI